MIGRDERATSAGTEAPRETTAGTAAGTAPRTGGTEGTEPEGHRAGGRAAARGRDVGVEGGSGCGIPHGPYEDAGTEPSGEVRVAFNQAAVLLQPNTNRGNATANADPRTSGPRHGGGFTYYDAGPQPDQQRQFGTCTVESLDPLTVTYRSTRASRGPTARRSTPPT